MPATYTHIFDLAAQTEPPTSGMTSKNVYRDEKISAMLLTFSEGHHLAEHTAASPAMMYYVKGEATVGLGDDEQEATAGTWVHMPAGLRHSVRAKTPVVMLLVMLK